MPKVNASLNLAALVAIAAVVCACSPDQRDQIDSTAGEVGTLARTAVSVIDVDVGKHLAADRKIADDAKSETFMPKDTIYASVHTSGSAKAGEVLARWTFPDGSNIDQRADSVVAGDNAYLAFFIAKPEGLAKGKYTFRVLVNDREVRSKEVTVQ
jgi:hypothetical protein